MTNITLINCYQAMPGHQFCVAANYTMLGASIAQLSLFQKKAVIGQSILPLLNPEDQTQLKIALSALIQDPKKILTLKLYAIRYQASAILSPDQKTVAGCHFTACDAILSPESKAEQTLDYISTIMPCHIFWIDRNGSILGCNDAMAKSAGTTKTALIGKSAYDILSPEEADHIRKIDQYVMNTGKAYVAEEPGITADGKLRYFLCQKTPLKNPEGKIIGMVGIAIDITHRKNLNEAIKDKERAELINHTKAELIANMSHDIRTPLNAIIGMTEMLKIKKHYETQTSMLDGISHSARAILNLIQDVLNFSTIKSSEYRPSCETFNLKKLLNDMITAFTQQINKQNINLVLNYPRDLPENLIGDPHATNRILSNLIGNAIKFTEEGYILVTVDMVDEDEANTKIQITIEDSGIGIEQDKLSMIFDRFYRAESIRENTIKGSGLGLSITKSLVEALGGTISVNSTHGSGSTFWVTLPFQLDFSELPKLTELSDQPVPVPVLIIDDHIIRGKTLLRHLNSKKHQLVSSSNAMKVLEAQQQAGNPFKIILIDDELKSVSYTKLSHMIMKKLTPSPMLLLCTHPLSLTEIENAKICGFSRVILKPAQVGELISIINATWANLPTKEMKPIKTKRTKLLVVDDNPLGLKVSKALLEELNCDIETATNAKETLDKMVNSYDAIFLDIGLPDINGLELTKLIRKIPSHKSTSIIALTAHATDQDRQRCFDAGMNDFLSKPASFDDFQKMLLKVRKIA